jgi:hypothetical protein
MARRMTGLKDEPRLVFLDDATGQLVQVLFVESESFFSCCQAAEGYLKRFSKPVAFYSDKKTEFFGSMCPKPAPAML